MDTIGSVGLAAATVVLVVVAVVLGSIVSLSAKINKLGSSIDH